MNSERRGWSQRVKRDGQLSRSLSEVIVKTFGKEADVGYLGCGHRALLLWELGSEHWTPKGEGEVFLFPIVSVGDNSVDGLSMILDRYRDPRSPHSPLVAYEKPR